MQPDPYANSPGENIVGIFKVSKMKQTDMDDAQHTYIHK